MGDGFLFSLGSYNLMHNPFMDPGLTHCSLSVCGSEENLGGTHK